MSGRLSLHDAKVTKVSDYVRLLVAPSHPQTVIEAEVAIIGAELAGTLVVSHFTQGRITC